MLCDEVGRRLTDRSIVMMP